MRGRVQHRRRKPEPAGPGTGRITWGPPPSPCLDLAGYKRTTLPFKPCIATAAPVPPSTPDWLHEIKHDGYRIVALRNGRFIG
jgi:ATP-dependent DNA ligase